MVLPINNQKRKIKVVTRGNQYCETVKPVCCGVPGSTQIPTGIKVTKRPVRLPKGSKVIRTYCDTSSPLGCSSVVPVDGLKCTYKTVRIPTWAVGEQTITPSTVCEQCYTVIPCVVNFLTDDTTYINPSLPTFLKVTVESPNCSLINGREYIIQYNGDSGLWESPFGISSEPYDPARDPYGYGLPDEEDPILIYNPCQIIGPPPSAGGYIQFGYGYGQGIRGRTLSPFLGIGDNGTSYETFPTVFTSHPCFPELVQFRLTLSEV